MSNAKALWFGAGEGAPRPDFVLFNDDRRLQGYKFNGSVITPLGNDSAATTLATADRATVCRFSATEVVVAGSDGFGTTQLGLYRFAGEDWSLIGNLLTTNLSAFPVVTPIGGANICNFRRGNGKRTFGFDGTDWNAIGNESGGGGAQCAAETVTDEMVAAAEAATSMGNYDWDGTDWNLNDVTAGFGAIVAMATLSPTRMALIDFTPKTLTTYDNIAGTWTQVGNSLALGALGGVPCMCALSESRVVVGVNTDNTLQAYDFDGTNWATVGSSLAANVPEYNNLSNMRFTVLE